MTDERAASRAAHMLPEELRVDSDDPQAQAEAILDDSDARHSRRDGDGSDGLVERRTSEEAAG